jgi:hypothetical protein
MKEIVVKLNKDNKRKAPGYVPEIKGRTKSRAYRDVNVNLNPAPSAS